MGDELFPLGFVLLQKLKVVFGDLVVGEQKLVELVLLKTVESF